MRIIILPKVIAIMRSEVAATTGTRKEALLSLIGQGEAKILKIKRGKSN